jgi:hypothetical protein
MQTHVLLVQQPIEGGPFVITFDGIEYFISILTLF